MLLGPPPAPATGVAASDPPASISTAAAMPLIAGLLGVAALGVTLGPVTDLLHAAATIVGAP
jgi:hydrogenase-4 component F